jgi:hypothetical protein
MKTKHDHSYNVIKQRYTKGSYLLVLDTAKNCKLYRARCNFDLDSFYTAWKSAYFGAKLDTVYIRSPLDFYSYLVQFSLIEQIDFIPLQSEAPFTDLPVSSITNFIEILPTLGDL